MLAPSSGCKLESIVPDVATAPDIPPGPNTPETSFAASPVLPTQRSHRRPKSHFAPPTVCMFQGRCHAAVAKTARNARQCCGGIGLAPYRLLRPINLRPRGFWLDGDTDGGRGFQEGSFLEVSQVGKNAGGAWGGGRGGGAFGPEWGLHLALVPPGHRCVLHRELRGRQ